MTALHAASYNGHNDVVTALLAAGVDVNGTTVRGTTFSMTPCCSELRRGTGNRLALPCLHSIFQSHGTTALYYAAKHGRERVVRTLLENGASWATAKVRKTCKDPCMGCSRARRFRPALCVYAPVRPGTRQGTHVRRQL